MIGYTTVRDGTLNNIIVQRMYFWSVGGTKWWHNQCIQLTSSFNPIIQLFHINLLK